MALIKCGECGADISTKAAACPSCGAPNNQAIGSPAFMKFISGFFVLVTFVVVYGVFHKGADPPKQPGPRIETPRSVAPAATEVPYPTKTPEPARNFDEAKIQMEGFLRSVNLCPGTIPRIGRSKFVRTDGLLEITVANTWHSLSYQVRVQNAQNLQTAWAKFYAPDHVDLARIKIVDLNGNEVGGSRALGGSLIWVQEK